MTNTIFYTFSTIAQTLAGAIALLGAFVLYRLQSLRSDIEIDSGEIVQGYPAIVHYVHAEHSSEVVIMNDWHRQGEYRKVLEFGKTREWVVIYFSLDPAGARARGCRPPRLDVDQRGTSAQAWAWGQAEQDPAVLSPVRIALLVEGT